ncbi:hypothetical protein AYL99_11023 [Fonsecaea erecta]|uniref:Uncharacterized protein n=1 Tax=Fonsecaea erecta TaxID=1367422 RepID=A0A178Z692_9EURO|nr:hypothetical protein AYL99_11023 [Fonsecaea erecta]OAP54575.1 hypothetical protein AYL99_11023 [Fonsecaea erecta]
MDPRLRLAALLNHETECVPYDNEEKHLCGVHDGRAAGRSSVMSLSHVLSAADKLLGPGPTPAGAGSEPEPPVKYDDENVPAGPRCHAYTEEHGYFVWYHRVDLEEDWRDVGFEFRARFGEGRALMALQSLYYSFSRKKGVECRVGTHVPGVMECTDKRYSWMLPEHRRRPRRH